MSAKSYPDAKVHYCKMCAKLLPPNYADEYCPVCKEHQLFDAVREYIRSNDVTEQQVAAHFGISQKQVKSWIKDGRIEYKETTDEPKIVSLHCEKCGAPLAFGTLCRKCRKLLDGEKFEYVGGAPEDTKMRFLDNEKEKKRP